MRLLRIAFCSLLLPWFSASGLLAQRLERPSPERADSLASVAWLLAAEGVITEAAARYVTDARHGYLWLDHDTTSAPPPPGVGVLQLAFATEQQQRLRQNHEVYTDTVAGAFTLEVLERYRGLDGVRLPLAAYDSIAAVLAARGLAFDELLFLTPGSPADAPPAPYPPLGKTITNGIGPPPAEAFLSDSFSVHGQTRRRLLDLVERLGLAPPDRIATARADLVAAVIADEVDLLRVLATGRSLRDERDRLRDAYVGYLRTLTDAGLLADSTAQTLNAAYQTDRTDPRGAAALLHELSGAATVSYPTAAAPLASQYRRLYRAIGEALPSLGLRYISFDATTAPEYPYGPDGSALMKQVLQLGLLDTVASSTRHRAIPPETSSPREATPHPVQPRIEADAINAVLAARHFRSRLVVAPRYEFLPDSGFVTRAVSVALVDSTAASLLFPAEANDAIPFGPYDSPFYVSPYAFLDAAVEDYVPNDLLPYPDHFLPPGTPQAHSLDVDSVVSAFRDVGLLDGLTAEQIADGADRARRLEYANGPGSIYWCFPRRVVEFDWEGAEVDGAYADLLRQFEIASRGHFALTDVEDAFPAYGRGGPYPGAFTLDGERYTFSSRGAGDWLDPAFLETLNRALKNQNIGTIEVVIDNGQAAGYAFFTPAELAALRERLPDMLPD